MNKYESSAAESLVNSGIRDDVAAEFHGSLRDWFAGQAVSGLCQGTYLTQPGKTNHKFVAEFCYRVADAMLEARNKE